MSAGIATAQVLDSRRLRAEQRAEVAAEARRFSDRYGRKPGLAAILVVP